MMKIAVIFRNGVTEAVLSDAPAGQAPEIEIVNIDDDYSDYERLKAHADDLYENPSMREIPYYTAHFDGAKGE